MRTLSDSSSPDLTLSVRASSHPTAPLQKRVCWTYPTEHGLRWRISKVFMVRRLRAGPQGDSELLLLPVEGALGGRGGGLLTQSDTGPLSLPTTPPPPGSVWGLL